MSKEPNLGEEVTLTLKGRVIGRTEFEDGGRQIFVELDGPDRRQRVWINTKHIIEEEENAA